MNIAAMVPFYVTSLLAIVLVCVGCEEELEQIEVQPSAENAKLDEQVIVHDIEKELGALSRGIANNDATSIFSIFSKEKHPTYVREGHIEESVEVARERYAKALAELPSKRHFKFEQKRYDVLDDRNVLFTGLGVVESPEAKEPWKIAYTILWSREAAGWKALSMHISWPASPN